MELPSESQTKTATAKRTAVKQITPRTIKRPIADWLVAALGAIFLVAAVDGTMVSHRILAMGLFILCISGIVFAWIRAAHRQSVNKIYVSQLAALIREIRLAEAPIETLSNVPDVLQPLGVEIRQVFHDLRGQKKDIANLHEEIRQRIANRTHALERLVESLKHQATRDALTKLYNRRMLDQILPQLVSQCLADESTLAVLMIDVDYFKDLNDTLGHAAGDELLRSLSKIIQGALRPHDAAFRYGGDEFVVLLPDCDVLGAGHVADRIRSLVNVLVRSCKVARPPRLSIGHTTLSELIEPTAENLLKRADEALYSVKSARRKASAA